MFYKLKVHWLKRRLSSIQIFWLEEAAIIWRRSRGTETNVLKLPGLKKKKPPELLVILLVFIFIFAFLSFLIFLQRTCIICANLNSFFLKPFLVLCSLPVGKVYTYLGTDTRTNVWFFFIPLRFLFFIQPGSLTHSECKSFRC